MPTYVALLRGINLGSTRRVAMADLREWLTALGYEDVRTLLQSGNAVFRTNRHAATVVTEVESALAKGAGFPVDCVLRTAAELRAVAEADPLGSFVTDPSRYLVSFLRSPAVAPPGVDPEGFLPERFVVGEREVYLWVPRGSQKSRMLAAFPSAKGQVATVRNWNTVTKLVAMV